MTDSGLKFDHFVIRCAKMLGEFGNNSIIRLAYEMSIAYLLNNWVRVFRLVKRLTFPVHLCVVSRHFQQLQRQALYSMNIGFSSKNLKFPLDKLTELLFLNTDTETQNLCQSHGLSIVGSSVHFLKSAYEKCEQMERQNCDYITARLRCWSISDILHGNKDKQTDEIERKMWKLDEQMGKMDRQLIKDENYDEADELSRELDLKCSMK